ncbi:hypothetical protein [uncultured Aquimarina sp.]|uniref:hypothetical protein n=1 Tax=uncultured Aquimarina sp. TaxID=575652 RepID=UPI002612841F|nr:hypothetical protein [uncultured Aquimarina sp.]
MNIKYILYIVFALPFISCTSKEEAKTQEFIQHAHNLNIEEIKNISTEDTRFYIKMAIESVMNLGDEESKKQLKHMASTLECSGEDNMRKCKYLDINGNEKFFEIQLIKKYNHQGLEQFLIDIDKKYFLGE